MDLELIFRITYRQDVQMLNNFLTSFLYLICLYTTNFVGHYIKINVIKAGIKKSWYVYNHISYIRFEFNICEFVLNFVALQLTMKQ